MDGRDQEGERGELQARGADSVPHPGGRGREGWNNAREAVEHAPGGTQRREECPGERCISRERGVWERKEHAGGRPGTRVHSGGALAPRRKEVGTGASWCDCGQSR